MSYLVDRSLCYRIIRHSPQSIIRKIESQTIGDIAISAVTVADLYANVERSTDPVGNGEALSQFLTPLVILPFDDRAAAVYGQVSAALSGRESLGLLDRMVAAQALSRRLTLATTDTVVYDSIPRLRLENWAAEQG